MPPDDRRSVSRQIDKARSLWVPTWPYVWSSMTRNLSFVFGPHVSAAAPRCTSSCQWTAPAPVRPEKSVKCGASTLTGFAVAVRATYVKLPSPSTSAEIAT